MIYASGSFDGVRFFCEYETILCRRLKSFVEAILLVLYFVLKNLSNSARVGILWYDMVYPKLLLLWCKVMFYGMIQHTIIIIITTLLLTP